MKIDRERLDLLKEIMAVDFSAIEMRLFLDTHPADRNALMLYNKFTEKCKMLKSEYESQFGCLSWACAEECGWKWTDDPWPWEIDYEMGGK